MLCTIVFFKMRSSEAKKRNLNSTGKKDQLLTRLLIWIRDEIAMSVDDEASEKNDDAVADGSDPSSSDPKTNRADGIQSDGEESCVDESGKDVDECDARVETAVGKATELIELTDDDESFASYEEDDDDDDDGDFASDDELEICLPASKRSSASTPKAAATTSNDATNSEECAAESPLHASLIKYFGHSTFRPGQEWAIRRTLAHKRTLLVAPTGQGKSLCYALPSVVMPKEGICLVVSPLISLMHDQLSQLPPRVTAATLSGNMTSSQMAVIVDDVCKGRYRVLFVSPERLASAAFRRLMRPRFDAESGRYERKFPPVSLLCVDEAHCLSQWGHNFRPSYLRVKSLLPLIQPKSILALTATAGPMVVRDICNALCIPFEGSDSSLGCDGSSVSSRLPSTLTEASSVDDDMKSAVEDGDGVKVLNCNRDNIDVFSLVLQSNDERRYLVSSTLCFTRLHLVALVSQPIVCLQAAQNFDRKEA